MGCGTQGPWGVGCGAAVTVTLRHWSPAAGSTHPSERFHKTLFRELAEQLPGMMKAARPAPSLLPRVGGQGSHKARPPASVTQAKGSHPLEMVILWLIALPTAQWVSRDLKLQLQEVSL